MKNNLFNNLRRPLGQLAVVLLLLPIQVWAITAVNTVIKNQASATFKDDSGQTYSVTSNMVETLVQQVAGVDLVQAQSKRGSIDGTVQFPHVLTNTGNGNDSYALSSAELTGDQFDFESVSFYTDFDQDGQPDDLANPITTTPVLRAGERFAFIAVVKVPATAASGHLGNVDVTATSAFTATTNTSNTDTVQVTNQAVVDVTKSMSATAGAAGSGTYTVTLRYQNTSALPATQVTLIDALPAGMTYVANSGRWSETGDALVLTDAGPADAQTATSTNIRYCAYDATCLGVAEATQDADTNTTNQVTALISQVPAGGQGTVSFAVTLGAGLPAGFLTNTAEQEYNDGTALVPRTLTNKVSFEVTRENGVVTNGSNAVSTDMTLEPINVASAPQGGTATFTDYVWNTGNAEDSFDLALSASTFPAGTVLHLFHVDGFTPLLDTNGNGIPDTGNLNPGEVAAIVLKAKLPPSATAGGYQVTLTATSFGDDSQSNPAINTLTTITSNTVDLTNNAVLGDAAALGTGTGPEGSALSTNTVAPGGTTRFTLYVNNTSAASDNFNLAASTDSNFATTTLPTGWTVKFVDSAGNIMTNTANIAPGTARLVYADVTVPADSGNTTTPLFFRALSPNTSASDIKHDAVTIGAVSDLVLEPNNQAQVLPGSVVMYSHWLINQGNIDLTDIDLTLTDTADGWTSLIYEDTNSDGILSGGDQQVSSIASLPSDSRMLLFVKVFAPATAPMGTANLTTVTASWNGGADSIQAEDLSTANRSDVQIIKEQAMDSDCNGVPNTAFSYDGFAAEPGECVLYRLTATNTGTETMVNVRIQDATPAYTSFIATGGLPLLSQGTLMAPITQGSDGEIIGLMGSLDPAQSATLTFGIMIE